MFMQRVFGVFRLNVATFEDIEHDEGALGQAIIILAIVALVSGIGSGLYGLIFDGNFLASFISAFIWIFLSWALWSFATFLVGTLVFKGEATYPEMLRVLGFAYTPLVLSIIPCIGPLVGGIWTLAAGFIAVRQGLDLDDMKTLATVGIGFLIYLIGWALLSWLIGFIF
jgi:hypothetical protein